MPLAIRTRLTLFFSLLFSGLLVFSMAVVYFRMSKSVHKDFKSEMIHDGRFIAELFKEELRLNVIAEFKEEIKEFGIELQVLDDRKNVVVQSEGWGKTVAIDDELLTEMHRGYTFTELKIDKRPFVLFSRPVHIPSVGRYSLHILRSQETSADILEKLRELILIVVPLMIILGTIAGFLFAGGALAPVETIRKKADSIRADDLSTRLPFPPQKDELYFLTETLNRMLDRIQSSFDRLKTFTADASHELRIPLTALRGNLEVALRKERSTNEYKESIQSALEDAEHLSQLIQDLLLLAQTDAGQIKLNIQNVNIKDFLKEVFAQSQTLPNENKVRMNLKSVPPESVRFDPERIRELLLNLIDNALKYSRQKGEMNLGAEITDGKLKINVQDTGIGISQADIKRIFDRFYRVDKVRSRQQGGSGLGLSIVRWIVEAHRGEIEVQSEEGKGSTFIVTLPI